MLDNKFKSLYSKDLGNNVEILKKEFTSKKTGKTTTINLKYLSWAFAVKVLKEEYPEAGYRTILFNGLPYQETKAGSFVGVELWLTKQDRKDGFTETYIFPVLDSTMKSVANPNSFQINTAHQRCLSKAIAVVTGLGLHLYTGEDIDAIKQDYEDQEEETKPQEKINNNQPNNQEPKQEKIITMQTEAEKKETKRKELEELMQTKAKAGVKVFTDWYQTYITKYPSVLQNKEFLDLVAKHDPTPKTPEDFERAKNLAMQEALEKSQKIS